MEVNGNLPFLMRDVIKDKIPQAGEKRESILSMDLQLLELEVRFRQNTSEGVLEQALTLKTVYADLQLKPPYDNLTPVQAKELVSDTGYFGVDQTAARLADFVLNGAGEDASMLRAGREGIIRGFEEAQELWGETLPDISYRTLEKALATIDTAMGEMGIPVLDKVG